MVPIDAMPITDRKEMQSQLTEHVRDEDVGILVGFVRIAGLVTDRSCKGELCNAIEAL